MNRLFLLAFFLNCHCSSFLDSKKWIHKSYHCLEENGRSRVSDLLYRIMGDIECLLAVFRSIPGILERGLMLEKAFRDRYLGDHEEKSNVSCTVC